MAETVLHFAPHPDDELIGSPAALMALRDAGWRVVNVACTLGRPEDRSRRRREAEEACQRAGFELVVPAPKLNISWREDLTRAENDLRRFVERLLAHYSPGLIVSPSHHDRHHGHEMVAKAIRSILNHMSAGPPVWWVWGLWGHLPMPTLAVPFDQARLDEILTALEAYQGELSRNDYRRLLTGRAMMNSSLGTELVFGFGAGDTALPYLELISELHRTDGEWKLGNARWLDATDPLGYPGQINVSEWLLEPSLTDRFGPPGKPLVPEEMLLHRRAVGGGRDFKVYHGP